MPSLAPNTLAHLRYRAEDVASLRQLGEYRGKQELFTRQRPEDRVGIIEGGRGSKTRQVRVAVERKVVPFSISELERDCPGVSRDTLRRVLRQMRDQGLLVAEGRGPGARWRST